MFFSRFDHEPDTVVRSDAPDMLYVDSLDHPQTGRRIGRRASRTDEGRELVPATGDRITKRKDGLFQEMYTVQTPDGPKRKYIYGRKYKDVERKLAEAMGDAAKGIIFDDQNITVSEYMTRWLEDSAKGDLGHRAYHNYRLQIRRHINPALGQLKLSKLTAAHIQSLYAAKLRDGLKPASVRYIHAVLHRALEQAVRFNLIPFNPAAGVIPPKVRQDEIIPLDADQARTLLAAARGDRFEALYVLSLTVGLRMGEALGLRWSDIDFDAKKPSGEPPATAGSGRRWAGVRRAEERIQAHRRLTSEGRRSPQEPPEEADGGTAKGWRSLDG